MGRRLLQALGLSTAFFFEKYYGMMNPSGAFFLHTDRPTGSIGWACLLDVLLGAAFFFALTEALLRTRYWGTARWVIGAGMVWTFFLLHPVLLAPWLMRLESGLARELHCAALNGLFAMKGRLAMLGALLLFFWWLSRHAGRVYRVVMATGGVVLMGMGFFGTLSFYYFARAIAYVPPASQTAAWNVRESGEKAGPRVVWIIFDELSERQLYEHRASGLKLPNFDRLRDESTVYADARPVGFWTEYVIPSLIRGEVYEQYRAVGNGKYIFLRASDQKWVSLQPEKSLFALAQMHGRNVGIAGWYNDYCGLFKGYAQSCYWTDGYSGSGPMLSANTTGQNMAAAVEWSFRTGEDKHLLRAIINDDHQLVARGTALLANDTVDFVFLHIPEPHFPHVYAREKGAMTEETGRSYADGLALADGVLGGFLDTLEADPRWAQTTLIVQGDHSWRVGFWKTQAGWTAEDSRISENAFDDRPALIVHSPGQSAGETAKQPVSLMKVHEVIATVLQDDAGGSAGNEVAQMPARYRERER
jgi:hypothetical protein